MSALAEQLTKVGYTGIIPARETPLTKSELEDIQSLQQYADRDTDRRMTEIIRRMLENSCAGHLHERPKAKFHSEYEADDARQQHLRLFPQNVKVVYRCAFCDCFHFGSPPTSRRLAEERELLDLAAKVREDLDRETAVKETVNEEQNLLAQFKIAKKSLADLEADYQQKREGLLSELAAIRGKIQAEVDLPLLPAAAPVVVAHRRIGPRGVDVTAELAKRIQTLRDEGLTWQGVATKLNDEGFRTMTGVAFSVQTTINYAKKREVAAAALAEEPVRESADLQLSERK
jgi:hypothetical protein